MKSHDTGLVIDSVSVLLKKERGSGVVAFATVHLNQGALHLHNFRVLEDQKNGVLRVGAPYRTKRTGEIVETVGFSSAAKEFFDLAVIEEYRKVSRQCKGGK